jgi:hypothetical protein
MATHSLDLVKLQLSSVNTFFMKEGRISKEIQVQIQC